MAKPPEFENWPKEWPIRYGPYAGVVGAHYDGDSPSWRISMGLGMYAWIESRLEGVYAKEIRSSDPIDKAQALETRDHLAWLIPVGTQVEIETVKNTLGGEKTTFDRYVIRATRVRDGLNVNKAIDDWTRIMGYAGGM